MSCSILVKDHLSPGVFCFCELIASKSLRYQRGGFSVCGCKCWILVLERKFAFYIQEVDFIKKGNRKSWSDLWEMFCKYVFNWNEPDGWFVGVSRRQILLKLLAFWQSSWSSRTFECVSAAVNENQAWYTFCECGRFCSLMAVKATTRPYWFLALSPLDLKLLPLSRVGGMVGALRQKRMLWWNSAPARWRFLWDSSRTLVLWCTNKTLCRKKIVSRKIYRRSWFT